MFPKKSDNFTPIKIPSSKSSVPETEVVNMTGTRYYGIEKWVGRAKKIESLNVSGKDINYFMLMQLKHVSSSQKAKVGSRFSDITA